MPLTSKFAVTVSAALTAVQDLGTAAASMQKTYLTELASGTAAGQADKVFHDQRTLAASTSEDLDLSGPLLDPLGGTLTFVKVKGIIVAASSGNSNNVVVGGAAATQFVGPFGAATHTLAVRPGGVFAVFTGVADATGYPVTPTTDLLKIANGGAGTSVTYDVIVIGTAA